MSRESTGEAQRAREGLLLERTEGAHPRLSREALRNVRVLAQEQWILDREGAQRPERARLEERQGTRRDDEDQVARRASPTTPVLTGASLRGAQVNGEARKLPARGKR